MKVRQLPSQRIFRETILPNHDEMPKEAVGVTYQHPFGHAKAVLWEEQDRLASCAKYGGSCLQGYGCPGIGLYPQYRKSKEDGAVLHTNVLETSTTTGFDPKAY